MDRKLREKIRQATEGSDAGESGFIDLLRLIDQHYDRMEATITQSLTVTTTPIEVVFDSVTEALMSVNEHGEVRVCNKVCSRYFGLAKDQIIGSNLEHLIPAIRGTSLHEFLEPFMADLDDTFVEYGAGEVEARRSNGENFIAEINASQLQGPEGRVYVISLRDVTGRHEAEVALTPGAVGRAEPRAQLAVGGQLGERRGEAMRVRGRHNQTPVLVADHVG